MAHFKSRTLCLVTALIYGPVLAEGSYWGMSLNSDSSSQTQVQTPAWLQLGYEFEAKPYESGEWVNRIYGQTLMPSLNPNAASGVGLHLSSHFRFNPLARFSQFDLHPVAGVDLGWDTVKATRDSQLNGYNKPVARADFGFELKDTSGTSIQLMVGTDAKP
ncbi:hypothetical protein [Paraferrimonas sedimenticola]|uniref:Uncharacterized protein n=1 Tax=Paraferrimonas sedimenticola TaxID=375674 RepID=A0AA37VTD9_9GAMM|nr:hypothetical protein [Paraferrimonas sedimenticola]GLP95231.1 hypothetical protein GCM10007895_05370 [Paraferrimonas sedimenticola]